MGKLAKVVVATGSKLTKKEKTEREAMIKKNIADVKAKMSDPLKKFAEGLEEQLNKWADSMVKRTWTMGKQLVQVRDDVQKYGEDSIQKLTVYLHRYGSDSLIQKAINFFTSFTEQQVETLTAKRMKISGTRLTWAHIEKLLTVQKPDKRDKYIEQTCENDWTPDELDAAIRSAGLKPAQPHAGGRPTKVPTTLNGRLENFSKIGHVFTRNDQEIWRHSEYGFTAAVTALDAAKITPELVAKLQADIEIADSVLETAEEVKKELEEAHALACDRMEEQAQKVAAEEAAKEEAAAKKAEKAEEEDLVTNEA